MKDAFYEGVVRPWLFRQEPEAAHERAMGWLESFSSFPPLVKFVARLNQRVGSRPVDCFGLSFPNCIGMAAGMDKNAQAWPAMAALGFGHVELGTMTLHAQDGNPQPRLFRYPQHEALVNRLGFPNEGAEYLARRIAEQRKTFQNLCPVGINIGKSRATPLEDATEDYLGSYRLLAPHADYIAINVSSPNTPNLRKLQDKPALQQLLKALQEANQSGRKLPLLVKIAPDLSFHQIEAVLDVCFDNQISGLIAGNTRVERPDACADVTESGGLSGLPINQRAAQVIDYCYRASDGKLPIIGVGGVVDHVSAGRLVDAGATLIQMYTGLVYRGPAFPRQLAHHFRWRQLPWT